MHKVDEIREPIWQFLEGFVDDTANYTNNLTIIFTNSQYFKFNARIQTVRTLSAHQAILRSSVQFPLALLSMETL